MCGIYGVVGQGIQNPDLKIFRDLGIINLWRGMDSTGIYFGNTRLTDKFADMQLAKVRNDALYFFFELLHTKGNEDVLKKFNQLNNTIYMGHNRSATIGNITTDNAHPFEFNRLVGAHNGTLVDDKYMYPEVEEDKYKTDSELLFRDLNDNLGKEIEILSKLDKSSAWALSIWDKKKKRLYLGHNDKRPLSFAINTERGVLYWSSEERDLEYVLNKHKQQYILFNMTERYLFEIDPTTIRFTESSMDNSYKAIHIPDNSADISVVEIRKKAREAAEKAAKEAEAREKDSEKKTVHHIANAYKNKKDNSSKKDLSVPNFHNVQSSDDDDRFPGYFAGVSVH